MPREVISGEPCYLIGSSCKWLRGPAGWGLGIDTAFTYDQWVFPKLRPVPEVFTLMGYVTPTVPAADYSGTYPMVLGSKGPGGYRAFEFCYSYSTLGPRLILEVDGTRRDWSITSAQLPVGKSTATTVTRDAGGNVRGWIGQTKYGPFTAYPGTLTGKDANDWAVGAFPGGTYSRPGIFHCALLWDRVLTDIEIRSLHANPYQLLESRGQRSYFIASGGATTGTVDLPSGARILTGGTADLPSGSGLGLSGQADLSSGAAIQTTAQADLPAGSGLLVSGQADLPAGSGLRTEATADLPSGTRLLFQSSVDLPSGAELYIAGEDTYTIDLPSGTRLWLETTADLPAGASLRTEGTEDLPAGAALGLQGAADLPSGTRILAVEVLDLPGGAALRTDASVDLPAGGALEIVGLLDLVVGGLLETAGSIDLPSGTRLAGELVSPSILDIPSRVNYQKGLTSRTDRYKDLPSRVDL